MSNMQFPAQGYGSPMHLQPLPGSLGEAYSYGMMHMLHPGTLMLPQQQQQQQQQQHHRQGTRNGRVSAGVASAAGI